MGGERKDCGMVRASLAWARARWIHWPAASRGRPEVPLTAAPMGARIRYQFGARVGRFAELGTVSAAFS